MRKKGGCVFSPLLVGIAADLSVRESTNRAGDSVGLRWKIKLNQLEKTKTVYHLKKIWLTDAWVKSETNLMTTLPTSNSIYFTKQLSFISGSSQCFFSPGTPYFFTLRYSFLC